MKYVKLFENWLYESDEQGQFDSKKPLDKSKLTQTAIVDITGKEVGNNPVEAAKVIESAIRRVQGKKDSYGLDLVSWVGDNVEVRPCIILRKEKKEPGFKQQNFILEDLETGKLLKALLDDLFENPLIKEYIKNKVPVFVVTSRADLAFDAGQDETKAKAMIYVNNRDKTNSPNYILIPTKENKGLAFEALGDKSFLEHKFYCADSNTKELTKAESLMTIITEGFGLGATNNLAGIAKLVGYTVPDNYAPKKGGIVEEK